MKRIAALDDYMDQWRTLADWSPLAREVELVPFQDHIEGEGAERMVADLGRRYGLKISSPVAARIADASGNDQAIVGQELQKLALYVGASPETPR